MNERERAWDLYAASGLHWNTDDTSRALTETLAERADNMLAERDKRFPPEKEPVDPVPQSDESPNFNGFIVPVPLKWDDWKGKKEGEEYWTNDSFGTCFDRFFEDDDDRFSFLFVGAYATEEEAERARKIKMGE